MSQLSPDLARTTEGGKGTGKQSSEACSVYSAFSTQLLNILNIFYPELKKYFRNENESKGDEDMILNSKCKYTLIYGAVVESLNLLGFM